MRYLLLAILGLSVHLNVFGQEVGLLPKRTFTANVGLGKHGTGDLYGIVAGFEYEKMFASKFSWAAEFTTTLHDGEDLLLVKVDNFPEEDMSLRYTTAGIQLAGKVGYHIVRTRFADYGIKAGVAARYQSTSMPDDSEILFPLATGYPLPVRIVRNYYSQRTIAAAALLQLFARYTFKKGFLLGLVAGGQMDTNGDVIIPQFTLSIGKRF